MTEKPTLKIATWGKQEQPPIVLLHGMLGSARYWNDLAIMLSKSHFVIAVDLLGFGHSPKPSDEDYGYTSHIDAIVKTIDPLIHGRQIVLAGHSLGALIALRMTALRTLDIQRTVLIGLPIIASRDDGEKKIISLGILPKFMMFGKTAELICKLMCRDTSMMQRVTPLLFPDYTPSVAKDAILHTWTSYSQSLEKVLFEQDVARDIERTSVPIDIIYGASDVMLRGDNGATKLLPTRSNIIVTILPKGSHQVPIEHPNLIVEFLE